MGGGTDTGPILESSGLGLLRRYGRWTLAYLALVVAIWSLGFEGIYENVTPFYALLDAATAILFVPLAVAVTAPLLVLVGWSAYRQDPRLIYRDSRGLLLTGLGFLAMIALLHTYGGGVARTAQDPLITIVLRHTLPWVVFMAGLVALVSALERLDWLNSPLSPRATAWLLVGLVAFSIAFSASIAMMRGGPHGIAHAYSRYQMEYIGDIGFGGSLKGLFAQYVPRHEYLISMHSKVHPPGPVALLWILSFFAGREAPGLSVATVVVGSLAVVPLYFWAKDLMGQRPAIFCSILYVLVPSVVLFTATSADILFMPFTLSTLFLFGRALDRKSLPYGIAAGVGYAVMSILSFSLLAVGAYFGLMGIWRLTDRRQRWAVLQTAVVMLAAFLLFHFAVRVWSGFDMVESFKFAKAQFDVDQANLDRLAPRYPSWAWKVLNPLAWFYFAGIPISLLFIGRLRRPEPGTRSLFIILALTFVVLDLLYLARGEGERSALYVFPFLILPAGHQLYSLSQRTQSLAPLAATAAFLAFQCWLTESFFYTYW